MSTDLKSRNHKTVGLTRFWGGENRGPVYRLPLLGIGERKATILPQTSSSTM